MQELKTTVSSTNETQGIKTVSLFIQSTTYSLEGDWQWDLQTDAVFCSDVIFNYNDDFLGTKGVIHPDDIASLQKNIYFSEAIGDKETFNFSFRIITTYGEVKALKGTNVRFLKQAEERISNGPAETLLKQTTTDLQASKSNDILRLRKDIADFSEKIHKTGTWYFNLATGETYYSDNYYRIFGLAPQSLNPQLHTFAHFIHPEDKDAVLDAIDITVREQLPLDIEYRIVKANDEPAYVQYTSHIGFNNAGETIVYGIVKNITEQKQKELQLEDTSISLDLQKKITDFSEANNYTGHWHVNLLTKKFVFSDYYYKIFGLKYVNHTPAITTLAERVHPDDRYEFMQVHRTMLLQNTFPDFEFRVLRADGKMRDVLLKGKSVLTERDEMVIIGTVKDVTAEKALNLKVRELSKEIYIKELGYRSAEQMASIAGWVTDVQNDTIWYSANFFNLLGIRNNNPGFSIKSLHHSVHPQDREEFINHTDTNTEFYMPEEFEFRLAARGETRRFKGTVKTVLEESDKYIITIIQDISPQFLLQQKLTERLNFTELLTESIQEIIVVVDTNYSILEWNRQCETAFNSKKEDVLNQNYFDVFPELKNPDIIHSLSRSLSGETVSLELNESTFLKGYHTLTLSPLKDTAGNISGILQVITDKTKETELQQYLNQRVNFIENIVEASIDPLIVLDKHLNYLYWNRQAELMSKINKEFVLGKNILEFVPSVLNIPTHTQFKKVLAGETVHIPVQQNEEGQSYEMYLAPVKDDKSRATAILWLVHLLSKDQPPKSPEGGLEELLTEN